MSKFEFIVAAGQSVNSPSKSYPGGARIQVHAESTTLDYGELILSREEAALLVERGQGRLVVIGGGSGLVGGSSARVGR